MAEKYQTGFDEPLLHTMFVDKKLSGVKAVQTLSRLNRTCFGKEDTFVLDFVNTAEDIQASFLPYYEESIIQETTDANIMYDLKIKLDEYRVYWEREIDELSKASTALLISHSILQHLQAVQNLMSLVFGNTIEYALIVLGHGIFNTVKNLFSAFRQLNIDISSIIVVNISNDQLIFHQLINGSAHGAFLHADQISQLS